MKVLNITLQSDYKGLYSLVAQLDKEAVSQAKSLMQDIKEGKPYDLTIKQFREKRSLTANAYFWVLCGKLSEKLGKPSLEIYRGFIKQLGIFRAVVINQDAADTFIKGWGFNGDGWICEKADTKPFDGFVTIYAYYGSSVFNTKQMGKLIDLVIDCCKKHGIETLTPIEIEDMKARWKSEQNHNKG